MLQHFSQDLSYIKNVVVHTSITLDYLVCNIKLHAPDDDTVNDETCQVNSQATYVVIDSIW
jgi:hypothetical protein